MSEQAEGTALLKMAQARALRHIFLAPSITEGLKRAKIKRRTYYNWLRDDSNFRQAIDEFRKSLVDKSRIELEGLFNKSVETLAGSLDDADPHVRIRSACAIINFILKYKIVDLETKIDRILARLEG